MGKVDQQGNGDDARARSRRRKRWLIGAAGSVLVAGATAFVAGLGSKAADDVGSSPPPLVSSYASEERAGCGPSVFLPKQSVGVALARPPSDESMLRIQSLPGFAFADHGRVNVSILGETERPVTLTNIYVHVNRRPRPQGALFYDPCGGPTTGRLIVFDLDRQPPRVVESNALSHVPLGSAGADGRPLTKPIKFPWTVSLTEPLLLGLIGTVKSGCYCTWTAEIPWVSGGQHGTIEVDNGGDGYSVVSSQGLPSYGPGLQGADRWSEQPADAFPVSGS